MLGNKSQRSCQQACKFTMVPRLPTGWTVELINALSHYTTAIGHSNVISTVVQNCLMGCIQTQTVCYITTCVWKAIGLSVFGHILSLWTQIHGMFWCTLHPFCPRTLCGVQRYTWCTLIILWLYSSVLIVPGQTKYCWESGGEHWRVLLESKSKAYTEC